MAYLLLHEQRIVAVLDQVRDIGVAQAVQRHAIRQAERVAILGEPGADLLQRHPRRPFVADSAPPPDAAWSNRPRNCSTHWPSTRADHGNTVSTLARRFGGLPLLALPHRTYTTP